MKRRVLAVGVAAATLATAGLAMRAAPLQAAASGASCAFTGGGTVSPPVTYKPQSVTYHFTGKVTCASTDKSLKSGAVTANGSGSISCVSGSHSASIGIAWNNGRSSSISVTFTDVTAVLSGSGTVTGGEFAGSAVHAGLAFYSLAATRCASGGLGTASLAGAFQIGA